MTKPTPRTEQIHKFTLTIISTPTTRAAQFQNSYTNALSQSQPKPHKQMHNCTPTPKINTISQFYTHTYKHEYTHIHTHTHKGTIGQLETHTHDHTQTRRCPTSELQNHTIIKPKPTSMTTNIEMHPFSNHTSNYTQLPALPDVK